MDEQLKSKLVGYLDSLEAKLKTGADFVTDETPKLVEEWLRWLAIESGIYAGCFLVASLATFALLRWAARKMSQEFDKYNGHNNSYAYLCRQWSAAFVVMSWMALSLFSIGTVHHGMHVAKVLTAPRVIVVEKIAELTGLGKNKR